MRGSLSRQTAEYKSYLEGEEVDDEDDDDLHVFGLLNIMRYVRRGSNDILVRQIQGFIVYLGCKDVGLYDVQNIRESC